MIQDERREADAVETEAVVRTMRPDDLEAVVAIDAAASGRRRPRYFELKIQRAVRDANLQVSLVAEVEGRPVGFLVATLYYGEYGMAEPSASIDAIGVEPGRRGRHVGHELMRQLRRNLGALRIGSLRTEVAWDDFELLRFFARQGFAPARRLCLESPLDPTAPGD